MEPTTRASIPQGVLGCNLLAPREVACPTANVHLVPAFAVDRPSIAARAYSDEQHPPFDMGHFLC